MKQTTTPVKTRYGREVRACCIRCGRRLQNVVSGGKRIGLGYDAEGYFHSKHCAAEWARDQARRLERAGDLPRDFA